MAIKAGSQAVSKSWTSSWMQLDMTLQIHMKRKFCHKKPISCQMSHNYLQKDLQINVWDIITLTIYAVFIFKNSMLYQNSRKCWSGWDTISMLAGNGVPYVLLSYSGQTVHWNTTVIQIKKKIGVLKVQRTRLFCKDSLGVGGCVNVELWYLRNSLHTIMMLRNINKVISQI